MVLFTDEVYCAMVRRCFGFNSQHVVPAHTGDVCPGFSFAAVLSDPKFEPREVTVPSFMIKTLSAAGLLNLLVLLLVGWGLSELGPRALAIAVLAPAFIASVAGLSVVWNLRPRLYQPSSLTNNHH